MPATSVPSTTITDETHLAGVDGTIALAQMPLTIASVIEVCTVSDISFDLPIA